VPAPPAKPDEIAMETTDAAATVDDGDEPISAEWDETPEPADEL
jgi:hypothetical protein